MAERKILIAEDEIIVSLDLKMLLQRNNYSVITIVSAGEDLISQFNLRKPDLIITDLKLGGKVSGLEAITEIRKIDITPIIIITGLPKSKLKKLLGTISNSVVLEKPFEQSDILYFANKFCGLHI
ncbi:MAG: response regulator [Ignavibacteriaceae bacterium]